MASGLASVWRLYCSFWRGTSISAHARMAGTIAQDTIRVLSTDVEICHWDEACVSHGLSTGGWFHPCLFTQERHLCHTTAHYCIRSPSLHMSSAETHCHSSLKEQSRCLTFHHSLSSLCQSAHVLHPSHLPLTCTCLRYWSTTCIAKRSGHPLPPPGHQHSSSSTFHASTLLSVS